MSEPSWIFDNDASATGLVQAIRQQGGAPRFDLAVVLGSGWGDAAAFGNPLATIPYRDWPCFPAGQVAGHDGRLHVVESRSWRVLVFSGRFHCYQGLSAFQAAFPVRLAAALGCPRLLLTCATGGINPAYRPGDYMLVDDHLNLLGDNPLRGLAGDVFIDLANTYRRDLYDVLQDSPELSKITLHRGVLAALSGPTYETPAEIRMLSILGADVVSMSTVPEAIMGRALGLSVAAVAFVSNLAAGTGAADVSHADVLQCSARHAGSSTALIRQIVTLWQDVDNIFPI